MIGWKEKYPQYVTATGRVSPRALPKERTDIFCMQAKEIHGDTYDYTSTVFTGSNKPLSIVCHIHGPFIQRARNHTEGRGCPRCGGTKKSSTEQFVKKARDIHENKYDYTLTNYRTVSEKVIIRCHEHGEFIQTPNAHLRGKGCPSCGGTIKSTTEEFITKAEKIHGSTYNYTNTHYSTAEEKVYITCKEHGDFFQTPHSHLKGYGCPKCSIRQPSDTVYLMHLTDNIYKIGISCSPVRRAVEISRESGTVINIVTESPKLLNALEHERHLLQKYTKTVDSGNIKFNGYTELRELTKEEVKEICSYLESL